MVEQIEDICDLFDFEMEFGPKKQHFEWKEKEVGWAEMEIKVEEAELADRLVE